MQQEAIITMIGGGIFGILASSGFWAYMLNRVHKKDSETKLLLGLACDRIVSLGLYYIQRGYIYKDEYDTLIDYLWKPYSDCGGDGTAEKIITEVKKIEIRAGFMIYDSNRPMS